MPAEAVIPACATKRGPTEISDAIAVATYRNTVRQTCSQPSPHRRAGSYPRLATYAASTICISSQVIGNEYLRVLCGHLIVAFPGRISLACVRKRLTPLRVKTTEHPFRRVSNAVKLLFLGCALLFLQVGEVVASDAKPVPGVSATEIKIGNLMPYSGPASGYSLLGKVEEAYFKKINDEGGINGRKIAFISYDDAFSPPKSVEQTRKLVESDEVFAIFSSPGTASNTATMKYLNQKKVPQIFVASGATKFGDPTRFPWTMGWIPHYQREGVIYGKHIISQNPSAKIAILYQNDDFGRDYLAGLKEGLGERAPEMLVVQASYETSEPTISSSVITLKASGADTLVVAAISKFATQAIRTVAELAWKPTIYVSNTAATIDTTLKPAGLGNAVGIMSAAYRKDPEDPAWAKDPGMLEFFAFMDRHYPSGAKNDIAALGYASAQSLVYLLRQCGDDLTRENFMTQAATLRNVEIGLLLPGITMNTSPTDFVPIDQFQMMRFNGEHWVLFGPILSP